MTITYTNTPTIIWTDTPPAGSTNTYTPTPVATDTPASGSGPMSITDVIIYPNPYQGKEPVYLSFSLTRHASQVRFKLYTAGFRLVRDVKLKGTHAKGGNIAAIGANDAGPLANGTYYYVITAEGGGDKCSSRLGTFIVIKK
jgi:hypothetical protein